MISAISSFNKNGTSVGYTNNETKWGVYRRMPALSNSIDTFQKSENLQQKSNKEKLSFGIKVDANEQDIEKIWQNLYPDGKADDVVEEVVDIGERAYSEIIDGLRLSYP